ncbi:MAG: RNA methyltransferase [Piscirickettsiaceae bacterium]|nr:MAG: RNA methyltransferase [Piscirickettsiaceae bacterium]
MTDLKTKLSCVTVALHWVVGITMIVMLTVGWYMAEFEEHGLYSIHKSVGMIIFVVILARVVWRIKQGWPEAASNYKAWEHTLSKIIHWALIIGTVLMPVSGMLMSGLGGYGLSIFGLELLAATPNPEEAGKMIPVNGPLAGSAHEVHEVASTIIMLSVLLHLLGAFKHHFIDKDGTLKRMLGKRID